MIDFNTVEFNNIGEVFKALHDEGIEVDCYTGVLDNATLWTKGDEIIGHWFTGKGYKHDGRWNSFLN